MQNDDNSARKLKYLAWFMMLVSFIGFVDAVYLTINRYFEATVPCTLTHACDTVLRSEYSAILGVPVVLIGAVYYLTIFLSSYAYLEYKSRYYFKITAVMTVTGFLFSAWLMYVQGFLLQAFCQYCLLSALTSTLLFALGLAVIKISSPSPLPNASGQE